MNNETLPLWRKLDIVFYINYVYWNVNITSILYPHLVISKLAIVLYINSIEILTSSLSSLLSPHLVVVFPTPPLPPTNTHFRVCCSTIFLRLGSRGSRSPIPTSSCPSAILPPPPVTAAAAVVYLDGWKKL